MNHTETTQLLAVIQTYDQRTVGETDVIAWHGVLGDLTFTECRDAVVGWFSTETDRLMPAHIRSRSLLERRRRAGEERQSEIESHRPASSSQELVPMPDWFWPTVHEHKRRAKAARQQAEEAGMPVSFGDAIVHALDRQPRGPRTSGAPQW